MSMIDRQIARKEQLLRELARELTDLVVAGELTEEQANEWLNEKADQWFGGDDR